MASSLNMITLKCACLAAALAAGCTLDKSTTDDDGTTDATAATQTSTTDIPTTGGEHPTSAPPNDGGTDSTAATSDTSTTSTTSTTDPPPPVACETGAATTAFKVDWDVDLAPCETESCHAKRVSPCIVSEIVKKPGPTILVLECNNLETGPTTDMVDVFPEPGGTIDLEVGAAVQFTYESQSHGEIGGWERVRVTDDRGLVFAAGRDRLYSFPDDDTQWAAEYLAELASPLGASFVDCTGEPQGHGIEVTRKAASVIVGDGGAATLTADASWLVVVEYASRQGQLELVILRVKP